jgi:hypothetical protein
MSGGFLDKISQIGVVIANKEEAISAMKRVFGADPSRIIMTKEDDGRVYRGAEGAFKAELIFYNVFGIEIEFIVPLKGPSIWQEYLEEHGPGLHHLQFNVESFEGARSQMHEAGIEMMQEGNSVSPVPGLKWGYFDSLGMLPFIIEITNKDEIAKKKA